MNPHAAIATIRRLLPGVLHAAVTELDNGWWRAEAETADGRYHEAESYSLYHAVRTLWRAAAPDTLDGGTLTEGPAAEETRTPEQRLWAAIRMAGTCTLCGGTGIRQGLPGNIKQRCPVCGQKGA